MKKLVTGILLASLAAGLFALPNLIKKEDFGADSIDKLVIDLSWEEVVIKETYDTSSIEVETYCNYKKHAPEVSVSGSTLNIESTKRSSGFFSTPTGLYCTVIIYLPEKKDFEEANINVSSGKIILQHQLSAKKEINLQAASGDITSEKGLFADSIKVSASSGDIDLFNLDADNFTVKTSSGDITIKKFTGENGSVHATSGDIKIEDYACEYANFNTSSGDISIKKLDCDYFDAESTSGSIALDLKNAPVASSSIESTSGNVDIYLPMRAKFSVDVSSTSGTFRDKFNNNRMNPRDNYTQDYNGGGSTLKFHTTSGNITLDY